jgi:chromosome segregation ATPase
MRRDVIAYLTQVSAERAEKEKRIAELESENRSLQDKIDLLSRSREEARAEADSLRQREKEYRVTVLDEAEKSLKSLEELYAEVSVELETKNAEASEECGRLTERFAALTERVRSCGGELRCLYAKIAESRMKLDGYLTEGEKSEEETDGDI